MRAVPSSVPPSSFGRRRGTFTFKALPLLMLLVLVGSPWFAVTGRAQQPEAAPPAAASVPTVSPASRPDAALAAGLSWVHLPSGAFQMGCVPNDERCGGDEFPRHPVTLSHAFDLMSTEVTVAMYRAVHDSVPEQPEWSTSAKHPVVIVTWDEARQFCVDVGGRLPTEAEWEFAARAGHDDEIYPWGNQLPAHEAGAPNAARFEQDAPREVGSFAANRFGLFDMAGNVWEWVADWGGFYGPLLETDPSGPDTGRARVVRGGSYGDDSANLRASNRNPNAPDRTNVNVGFRCARDISPQP